MRYAPTSEYDNKESRELNAEPWQLDLLKLNPSYCNWGPHEDYMMNEKGWLEAQIYASWEAFGPYGLDDYNEVVNFYFSVRRENASCVACGETGYAPDAKRLADDWYDFACTGRRWCDKITQEEVQALWDAERLRYDFRHLSRIPTAEEVNAWERGKGIGHDAINRGICIEARCKRLGYEVLCPVCGGKGYVFTAPAAHVALTLWVLHPRKGASRGVEIKNIQQLELPAIFAYLKDAAARNAERFSRLP